MGEIKEHDPDSACRLLQVTESLMEEEDDGVVHSHARLVCKLHLVNGLVQHVIFTSTEHKGDFQETLCRHLCHP